MNVSFPLNVILTKWAALLKLETSSEMDRFQLCYWLEGIWSLSFSVTSVWKTGRLETENERREVRIESLTTKSFHKRRIILKVRKCQLRIDKENEKTWNFLWKRIIIFCYTKLQYLLDRSVKIQQKQLLWDEIVIFLKSCFRKIGFV